LPNSYTFQMWAHNNNSSYASSTWYGIYKYHSASKQIIEVLKDNLGNIVGVHTTEKGNENSIKRYDTNKQEIADSREILTAETSPSLFDANLKKVKYTAEFLIKKPELLIKKPEL